MSSDGQTFNIDETVAMECQTLKHMIEDNCADSVIPVPKVTGNILAKVIDYCSKHVEAAESETSSDDDLKNWDAEFVKVDQPILFEILLAANFLCIKSLLDLGCQTVADMIKDKSVEEVRNIFNIKNDFSPGEEEELRRQNQWAFE